MRKPGKIMIVVAAALAVAACSPHEEPSPFPPGGGPSYPAPNPVAASSAAPSSAAAPTGQQQRECTADDIKVSGAFGSKPTITIPDACAAPTKLLTKDLTPGSGAAAKAGSALQMNYDLVTWSDKADQQNSFSAQPFSLTLGQGTVIPGWDQGLVGVKQGARRLLVVPPNLGYGAQGQGPVKPNETLVFVVDLLGVR